MASCVGCTPVLHAVPQDSNKEEHAFRPPSPCQRNSERERARSRSPLQNSDLGSRLLEYMEHHRSLRRRKRGTTSPPSCASAPRGHAAPGPSNSSSLLGPAPRAPREQAPPRQRERSRSPCRGHDLRSPFLEYTDHHRSLTRSRAARCWTQEVPGLWQLRGRSGSLCVPAAPRHKGAAMRLCDVTKGQRCRTHPPSDCDLIWPVLIARKAASKSQLG